MHLHYKGKIFNVVGGEKPFFLAIVHWEKSRSGVLILFIVSNITRLLYRNQQFTHITKTPTHYKTHIYTYSQIIKPT